MLIWKQLRRPIWLSTGPCPALNCISWCQSFPWFDCVLWCVLENTFLSLKTFSKDGFLIKHFATLAGRFLLLSEAQSHDFCKFIWMKRKWQWYLMTQLQSTTWSVPDAKDGDRSTTTKTFIHVQIEFNIQYYRCSVTCPGENNSSFSVICEKSILDKKGHPSFYLWEKNSFWENLLRNKFRGSSPLDGTWDSGKGV